jgi:hypothetical protein
MKIIIHKTPTVTNWYIERGHDKILMGTETQVLNRLGVHPSKIFHECPGDMRRTYLQEKLARIVSSYLKCKTKDLINKWGEIN